MILRPTNIRSALRSRQRGFLLNPARFGGNAVTDPYFSYVVALLHGNGVDASTTCTDSAGTPKTYTANGNAQIDTAQSKFGGASMLFDGSGDYFSTPNHTDFNFGSGDFTIELWVRFNSVAGTQTLISNYQGVSNGWSIFLESGKITCQVSGDGSDLLGVTSVTTGQWYHVAVARTGTTLKLFLDGAAEHSITNSANITSTAILAVGRLGSLNSTYFNGWLDDIRVTNGIARYSGTFSVPSSAYPDA